MVGLLLVASCGDDDDSTAAPSSTSGGSGTSASPTSAGGQGDVCTEERKGGELTYSAGSLQTLGMDPTVSYGFGLSGGSQLIAMYDAIMRWDPATSEFEPWLAESLTPNADYTVWTLKLRPNIKFGNGDPLTATATMKSFQRAVEKPTISATDRFRVRPCWPVAQNGQAMPHPA